MDDFSNYIVGAYATSPSLTSTDMDMEARFINSLKEELGIIRGLELPFWGSAVHQHDESTFLSLLEDNWEYAFTCLPGTMDCLKANKHFGIASDNEAGRTEAVQFYRRVSQSVQAINNRFGGKKVISIAMGTSPSLSVEGVNSSSDALVRSLEEIAQFPWDGAQLLIEHCDSGRSPLPAVKGFLSLEEELEALHRVKKNHNIDAGITINWARSAIEHRSVEGPCKHMHQVGEQLSGLMFSGTSSTETSYGTWSDFHMPTAPEDGLDYYEKGSLLTAEQIKSCITSIDVETLLYIGVKVLAMPMESASIKRRVGINKDSLTLLHSIIQGQR